MTLPQQLVRRCLAAIILTAACITAGAQHTVTIHATDRPAAEVFRSLIAQTGMNFIYSSDLLTNMRVSIDAARRPLTEVLDSMFGSSQVEYVIRGNNVLLRRRPAGAPASSRPAKLRRPGITDDSHLLDEVVVVSRLEAPAVETAEIGARKITADQVRSVPALFGEPDVIKALQTQPGISSGSEGMASMHVHGGNADENLYMLDNVPMYQANHFAGLFSAFNADAIQYVDFFKSSIPARYDGRLSSFMDVRTRPGSHDGHHGSGRLGLTSGAFSIGGPIGERTRYMAAIRRSWYDVISTPALALINSGTEEKVRFHYHFMDLNARIDHQFSRSTSAFLSVYYGDDRLTTGTRDRIPDSAQGFFSNDRYRFHWGNIMARAGVNHRLSTAMTAEFTGAYTRFFSGMDVDERTLEISQDTITTRNMHNTRNNIHDWIFRADMDWTPTPDMRIRFGAGYVHHSFLPARTRRVNTYHTQLEETTTVTSLSDSTSAYPANEAGIYIEDDWRISPAVRINAGVNASLFAIDGRVKHAVSPRLSVSWRPLPQLAIKGAYSRTSQYVHQLTQTYLSLPTDQWIPVAGDFKPQTADKVAVAAYWESADGAWSASVEAYYKWMYNLLEYRDEYYLSLPTEMWTGRLTSGSGRARGIDFALERRMGRVTGSASYSLAWADRLFAHKNGGHRFPARFDHRHTLKLSIDWQVSAKVRLGAYWTGHSGDRFTLMPQVWSGPQVFPNHMYSDTQAPLRAPINNYQLPFYHRLDLSCTVNNSRGYWTFGIYNAYCHLNTIAVRRTWNDNGKPVFQRVCLLPIIPSISYTWIF